MSATMSAHDAWVKTAIGFDIQAARGAGDEVKERPPANGEAHDEERKPAFAFFKRQEDQTKGLRPPPPKDKALREALENAENQLEALDDLGIDVKRLRADLLDCAKAGDRAEKMPAGPDRDKAIEKTKKRLEDLLSHEKALASAIKSVMGAKAGKPSADDKSKAYKKALEDYYGLTIENPDGMANTHFDRVFDMFGTAPKGDAKQDKLTTLKYISTWGESGAYNKVELAMKMGDFGDASSEENYEIDGEVLPVNSFDVTTLHEIGHAVDFKHGVMTNNGAKAGCGGWVSQSVDDIAAVFLANLKTGAALSPAAADNDVKAAIKTALKDGTTDKPDTIEQADWDLMINFLVDKCLPIRSAEQQWWENDPIQFGGKVYQQAYARDDAWWRYEFAARAATKVNQYQWRAPGEWFAEVYAISWLKKKKPPAGVDAAMLPYMWQE